MDAVIRAVIQAAHDLRPSGEPSGEVDLEVALRSTAGEKETPRVGLAPVPEVPGHSVACFFAESSLLLRLIRGEDRGGLVVHIDLNVYEPLRRKKPCDAISERVVAFAERDLTP